MKLFFAILFFAFVNTESVLALGHRKIVFTQTVQPKGSGTVEAWIPVPLENKYFQTVLNREFRGNATLVRWGSSSDGRAGFVYAKWINIEKPELVITYSIETEARNKPMPKDGDIKQYMQATSHVQTDGIVLETARKIVAKSKDDDVKARAIYDWIIEKASRNPDTRGCGLGDVKTTLTVGNLRGKCADINSLFVGLARAAGIPARETFGQRVTSTSISSVLGKEGDNSKSQHCRAEYYSQKKRGWIPVDPADVRKIILEEKLEADSPRINEISDALFGKSDGNWIAFNYARDFVLNGYDSTPINYFMYPLIISKDQRPDGVDPLEAGYQYTSALVDSFADNSTMK